MTRGVNVSGPLSFVYPWPTVMGTVTSCMVTLYVDGVRVVEERVV